MTKKIFLAVLPGVFCKFRSKKLQVFFWCKIKLCSLYLYFAGVELFFFQFTPFILYRNRIFPNVFNLLGISSFFYSCALFSSTVILLYTHINCMIVEVNPCFLNLLLLQILIWLHSLGFCWFRFCPGKLYHNWLGILSAFILGWLTCWNYKPKKVLQTSCY